MSPDPRLIHLIDVVAERSRRARNLLDHPCHQRIGSCRVGEGLIGENKAVPQDVGGELGDVAREHVVATAEMCERAGAEHEVD
jgi:hypothetical protein